MASTRQKILLHHKELKNCLKIRFDLRKNTFQKQEYLENRKKTTSAGQKLSFHQENQGWYPQILKTLTEL